MTKRKSTRVVRKGNFILIKVFDRYSRDTIFHGQALISDKAQVKKLFKELEDKGIL